MAETILDTRHTYGSYSTLDEYRSQYSITRMKFALSSFQRDELLSLALKTNYKHYLLLKMAMDTGLRVNEIANLEIPALNFLMKIVTIQTRNANRHTKAFKTKTKAGNRIIPLEKSLALEIRSYIGIKKHGYVFLSQKGHNPYRKESIINFINRYAKECSSLGFSIGMHSLRRTFCSFMSKKQIPMGKLSKMMGHKDIKTTFLYLYEIDDLEDFDDVRQAVREMHEQ